MRLVSYSTEECKYRVGAVIGDATDSAHVVDLAAFTELVHRSRSSVTYDPAVANLPGSLLDLLRWRSDALDRARDLIAYTADFTIEELIAHGVAHLLAAVRIRPPVPEPPSVRDFYAFEDHVRRARQRRGLDVPEAWYQFPVFYFSNPAGIVGPDDPVPYPRQSAALDYELEVAAIVGRACRDVPVERAEEVIAGYTILNDWSARDVQRAEMQVGLGPAKAKDFATSLGPFLVTADELADRRLEPGRYDVEMVAYVNGVERSRGNWRAIHWTFAQMVARASENTCLRPGDIIGSGTVGSGCLLEQNGDEIGWLRVGDVVELSIDRLGVLRNRIIDSAAINSHEEDAAPGRADPEECR